MQKRYRIIFTLSIIAVALSASFYIADARVFCITDQGPPVRTGCNPVADCSICINEGLGCSNTPGPNCDNRTGFCRINQTGPNTQCSAVNCSTCPVGLLCDAAPGPNCFGSAEGFCLVNPATGETGCNKVACSVCTGDGLTCVQSRGPNCTANNGFCRITSTGTDTQCTATDCATCSTVCDAAPGPNCSPPDDGGIFSCTNPLVPCGRPGTPPCNLCHFYNLARNVINFCLFCFILPVSVVALLIGGIFLLASMGNPQKLQTGKTAITNTVIGIIIAFAAWLIIATILNTLGYQGFTPGWSDPPVCVNPIRPISRGHIVRESCTFTTGTINIEPCSNSNPNLKRICNPDGFWSACFETCDPAAVGITRACDVGGCVGTQTCEMPSGTAISRWSEKCTKTDPTCVPKGGGVCPTPDNGFCSISALSASCFGGSRAFEAAQICGQESFGGQAKAKGDSITGNGKTVYRSIGLFQINLSANNIAGISPPCPTAFEGPNRPLKPGPEAQALYDRCVAAAEDPATNIAKACELRTARGSWGDWSRTARTCNL